MPVAVAEKGLKRICPSCGTRYYDMNKRPVVCPSCTTEFTGELKVKTRRGRLAAVDDTNSPATAAKKSNVADNEDDAEVVEAEEDTVSLEEVEAAEEGEAAEDADADLEIDDDLDASLEDLEDDLEEEIVSEDDDKA